MKNHTKSTRYINLACGSNYVIHNEWINLDLKEGKSGKGYAAVNTWKPESKAKKPMGNIESNFMEDAVNSSTPDDLPF